MLCEAVCGTHVGQEHEQKEKGGVPGARQSQTEALLQQRHQTEPLLHPEHAKRAPPGSIPCVWQLVTFHNNSNNINNAFQLMMS